MNLDIKLPIGLIFMSSLLLTFPVLGQVKFEREFRIKDTEVPQQALDFIDALQFRSSIKWYKEISQDGETVEAKFKYDDRKYSIEFDALGRMLDIEIDIGWNDISPGARENIREHLDSIFPKYKIEKIQIQYTGETGILISLLREEGGDLLYTTRYEIEVRGKKEGGYILYEILYDQKGNKVQMSEVINRGTDNIEY